MHADTYIYIYLRKSTYTYIRVNKQHAVYIPQYIYYIKVTLTRETPKTYAVHSSFISCAHNMGMAIRRYIHRT